MGGVVEGGCVREGNGNEKKIIIVSSTQIGWIIYIFLKSYITLM